MRPLTAALPLCLGLVLTLAAPGCGGTRVRDKDGSVTVEPEPEPEPHRIPAPERPPRRARRRRRPARHPTPAGPDPTTARPCARARRHRAPLPPDAAPPLRAAPGQTCGGVTCPALFQLVHPCRPMGGCMLNAVNPVPITFCYANGIKVVGESILPPNLVGLVKRADGSRLLPGPHLQNAGSADRNVVWETPAGVPVASGVFDSAGNGTITCDAVTAPLTDPTCVAVPSPQGCTPGFCL